jgi:hypothetical protein
MHIFISPLENKEYRTGTISNYNLYGSKTAALIFKFLTTWNKNNSMLCTSQLSKYAGNKPLS